MGFQLFFFFRKLFIHFICKLSTQLFELILLNGLLFRHPRHKIRRQEILFAAPLQLMQLCKTADLGLPDYLLLPSLIQQQVIFVFQPL